MRVASALHAALHVCVFVLSTCQAAKHMASSSPLGTEDGTALLEQRMDLMDEIKELRSQTGDLSWILSGGDDRNPSTLSGDDAEEAEGPTRQDHLLQMYEMLKGTIGGDPRIATEVEEETGDPNHALAMQDLMLYLYRVVATDLGVEESELEEPDLEEHLSTRKGRKHLRSLRLMLKQDLAGLEERMAKLRGELYTKQRVSLDDGNSDSDLSDSCPSTPQGRTSDEDEQGRSAKRSKNHGGSDSDA